MAGVAMVIACCTAQVQKVLPDLKRLRVIR